VLFRFSPHRVDGVKVTDGMITSPVNIGKML